MCHIPASLSKDQTLNYSEKYPSLILRPDLGQSAIADTLLAELNIATCLTETWTSVNGAGIVGAFNHMPNRCYTTKPMYGPHFGCSD